MTKVVLATKAVDDFLKIIADLIGFAGFTTASSYDAKLKRLISRLAAHPESGSPRPKLGRSIRIVVLSPYVVFYLYDAKIDVVSIVRIRHQRQQTGRRDLRRQ